MSKDAEGIYNLYAIAVPFAAGNEDAMQNTPIGKVPHLWHLFETLISCPTCGLCTCHAWTLSLIKNIRNNLLDWKVLRERKLLASAERDRLRSLLDQKIAAGKM